MKKMYIIAAIFLFMMLCGCQSMTYNIDSNIGLRSGASDTKVVYTMSEIMKAHYLFWGIVPVSTPDIDKIATQWLQQNDNQYIADIEINEENSMIDGFFALITCGIYRPRTIHYTARVFMKEGSDI